MFENFNALKSISGYAFYIVSLVKYTQFTRQSKPESMSLVECSSIVTALTAALRIDGESVDIFTIFMTSCKTAALSMGIELPAVPRGPAKRVNRGNRLTGKLMMKLLTTITMAFGQRYITLL